MVANLAGLREMYDAGIMKQFSTQGHVEPPTKMIVETTLQDKDLEARDDVEQAIRQVANMVNN